MAGTIMTPVTIWHDFKIDSVPTATSLYEKKENNVIYTGLRIEGRKAKDGQVGIFAELAKTRSADKSSAIIILKDFQSETGGELVEVLAKKGFVVLSVDLGGVAPDKEYFTEYPESISYANYENVKDNLEKVEKNAIQTCWYEWVVVARHALAFFRNMIGIVSVGGLGIGDASTVLWQVAGTDRGLDCATFVLDSGWRGYRGIQKFDGGQEPQFSDERYKFIAGIEPEAYASHIQCPVLMLASTNSNVYDCDRAYDTVSRINDSVYRAVHYSVGYTESVNADAFSNCINFFMHNLRKDKNIYLPEEMEVKGDIMEGRLVTNVAPDTNELQEVCLYVSEGMVTPSLRNWNKVIEFSSQKEGVYTFEYSPYHQSGIVVFFAVAKYKSGFSICSPIQARKFSENEVSFSYKSKIIYSSRIKGLESTFFPDADCSLIKDRISINGNEHVKVKKGPMGIEGITSSCRLMTFKMTTIKDKPNENAILMFDIYSQEDTEYTVSLIADYFGERMVYSVTGSIRGGEIWHNVKINRAKFKTLEGRPLKDYQKIEALGFETEKESLINNALWV